MADASLEQLQRDVQYLKDRLAIQDVVARHARGVDRHDAELLDSCYHEDGAAAYGTTVVPAREHSEWSNTAHAGRFALHGHHITTHTCEIEGDVAYAESYMIGTFLSADQKRASFVAARYVDQLERRDGEWRIAARRAMTDIALEGDASFLGAFRGRPVEPEHFTRDDLSYQRPVDLTVLTPGGTEMAKVWFITGTSSGFGWEWARAALERGDHVAGTARNLPDIDGLVSEFGDAFLPLQLDVKDRAADVEAVRRAHERFGRLDVVVNNAGYAQLGMVEEVTEQQVRDEMDTNGFGALWVTQAALPILRAQGGGHIVNLSSVAGIFAYPGVGIYNASKWALEGWSQSLAAEVAGFGIRVTIVEPGGFATGRDSRAGHSEHLDAYGAVWDHARELAMGRSSVLGDPKATSEVILQIVDSDDPPLRLFLGSPWLRSATAEYERRLQTWRETQHLAELSEGPEATAHWRGLDYRIPGESS